MKELLISALDAKGCASPGCPDNKTMTEWNETGLPNMTIINGMEHLPNETLMGVHGALVIQEDLNDITVNADDSDSFFVIGLVRRPCDFMVASWAAMSPKAHLRDNESYGVNPPYNNAADRARFETWANKVVEARDQDRSTKHGAILESVAFKDRYGEHTWLEDSEGQVFQFPKNVHCWVRTEDMAHDLRVCMHQYQSCGGTWHKEGLSDAKVEEATERANKGIPPGDHATCSQIFTQGTSTWNSVMKSEKPLVDQYHLGKCCS